MGLEVHWANRLATPSGESDWAALADEADRHVAASWDALKAAPTAFVVADTRSAACVVALTLRHSIDAMLVVQARETDALRGQFAQLGLAIYRWETADHAPATAPGENVRGRIRLLTSGTTGAPKLVEHTWTSLNTFSRIDTTPARRWLLPYQVGTYAWYQLISMGLFLADQDLVSVDPARPDRAFDAASRLGVTACSSTPTFWRVALMSVDPDVLESIGLLQITLGGETVDQPILDALRGLYPAARITHVYASSEVGACVVVQDGLAGFPAAFLADSGTSRPFALDVRDGHLWVRSCHAAGRARDEAPEWIDTGDRVEIRDDRVHFLGRAETMLINVGGNKAFPADVEACLLSHPDVRWCRVTARRAPLVGYLPQADVYVRADIKRAELEASLWQHCSDRLPEFAVPRIWNFLDGVPISQSLKTEIA